MPGHMRNRAGLAWAARQHRIPASARGGWDPGLGVAARDRMVIAAWGEQAECGWSALFPIMDAEVSPLFSRLG